MKADIGLAAADAFAVIEDTLEVLTTFLRAGSGDKEISSW